MSNSDRYTQVDLYASLIEEQEFRAFAERKTDKPPRSKQQILDDTIFYESLTNEEKIIYQKIKLEEKVQEMKSNEAEVTYKTKLTNEELVVYNKLKEEERQANFNKAIAKMKFT